MIREAVADGVRTVVINLEDATAIDSSGVSDLASGHMALSGTGGALKLCCLTKKLQDVFVITRLNQLFDIKPNENDALAGL